MNESYIVLLAFALWTAAWVFVMVILRMNALIRKKKQPTDFTHTGQEISPFAARISRVHANCLENLPILASIVFVASQTGTLEVVNNLAWVFLATRVLQSLVHALWASQMSVMLRGMLYSVQSVLMIYWTIQILLKIT